jgi:hypothetical protein
MPPLVGTPSDEAPDVLATGRSKADLVFVSLSARHPGGLDAEYLEWHTVDHRPEQHRIPGLLGSLRFVSTPECRGARAASSDQYDAVDHVMTYYLESSESMNEFMRLGRALRAAGRYPSPLAGVERTTYAVTRRAAASRIKVGADVLPWWPTRGLYLLIEVGHLPPDELLETKGVGGAWWGTRGSKQITFLYLDDDPVQTAGLLLASLKQRWSHGSTNPMLAAPFHTTVPFEWNRYLP